MRKLLVVLTITLIIVLHSCSKDSESQRATDITTPIIGLSIVGLPNASMGENNCVW